MDKYEYQVCADQIKELAGNGRYAEAMDIADTIDWRRVKSFSMLCTVSEIYKVNKHYDESREILLLAYERYPDRASVIYALCELDIKLGDIEEAKEFYKEFCSLKPKDTNRYVLLYRLYEAMDYTLEDKISLLEEFKRAEYTEKWAYELALLYHKTGQEKKCVETCDEMIIWFGDGPYVKKAMELKMQHAELSEEQQRKYDGVDVPASSYQEQMYAQGDQYQQPQQNYDPYNQQPQQSYDSYSQQPQQGYDPYSGQAQYAQQNMYQGGYADPYAQGQMYQQPQQSYDPYGAGQPQPYDNYQGIQVQPVSTGKYSTINLQEELARNMQEVYGRDAKLPDGYYGNTAALYEPSQREYMQQLNDAGALNEDNSGYGPDMQYENGSYETAEGGSEAVSVMPVPTMANSSIAVPDAKKVTAPMEVPGTDQDRTAIPGLEETKEQSEAMGASTETPVNTEPVHTETISKEPAEVQKVNAEPVISEHIAEPIAAETVNIQTVASKESSVQTSVNGQKDLDKILAQEYNGQISLSLPDPDMEIKQITGQIDISDFLKEWEEKKRLGQQQRLEETKKRQMEQTSDIMSQLAGVIPGIEIKKPEETKPVEEKPLRKEEIVRSDDNGTLTKTTLKAPSYDNRDTSGREVKRTETGAIINGPLKSRITGQIPDVLPAAPAPSMTPNVEVIEREQEAALEETNEKPVEKEYVKPAKEEPKPIVIPDYILNEESAEEEIEADLPETEAPTPETVDDLSEEKTEKEPEKEEASSAESKPNIIPGFIPEPDFLRPLSDLKKENPVEDETEPETLNGDEEWTLPELPKTEIPLNEEVNAPDTEEVPEDLSDDKNVPAAEDESDMESEDDNASEKFPFDLTSELDPVEDLVDVEQSDDVEDLLKTGAIPLFDIDPEALESNNKEEEKKPAVPTYMNMDELNNRREARRDFDPEERRIFGRFEGIESLKAQIVDVMEDMSMDAAVGNVVVTGSELYGRKSIAIDIVKAIQIFDTAFGGKVAKISGEALNKKDIPMTLHKLHNGALIVENAGGLLPLTVNTIIETLTHGAEPILVVFEDEKDAMEPLLAGCQEMKTVFNARIEIADFSNNDLVAYANGYAREQEYSIDEMGEMELHTRIDELQSSIDDVVTVDDVKEIVDNAIRHVDRKNMSHFMDVLVGKRYDEDDYIVLRAKDFQN